MSRINGLFSRSRKHVAVWQCFMTAQPHDVGLAIILETTNLIGEQNATFLTFSPLRAIFMEVVEQTTFVPENKGVSRDVLPPKIHSCGFHITIPGVEDVLTDVVQQCFHLQLSDMGRMDQYMVCEQPNFLHSAQRWQAVTRCHLHVIMAEVS